VFQDYTEALNNNCLPDSQRQLKNDEFQIEHISRFIFVNNSGKKIVSGIGKSVPSIHFIFNGIEIQGTVPIVK
jgi:hypothetical protein